MLADPTKQKNLIALKNSRDQPLQIVCEPACSEYRLPPNSEIVFKAEVGRVGDGFPPIIVETTDYGLTLWFEDALYDPDAEIDGRPTEPFSW